MIFEQIAKSMASTVKESVESGVKFVLNTLGPRIKSLEDKVDQFPDALTVEEIEPILKQMVSEIVIPIPEKGDKGDSVTVEEIEPILKQMVSEIVIPAPEKGDKGDSVTVEEIEPILKQMVSEIVIPVPEKGDKGDSVTVEEIEPIVKNLVDEAVSQIPIPEKGKDAEPIDMQNVQKMIDAAVEKAVSAIVVPEPRNGEDGKDALNIEILPEIDESKSYCRNSYAIHKGGLWRTYENTKGMRGWECVVDGVADISIEYDGERDIIVKTEKSSGCVVEKRFIMPVMIYKEVWRPGPYKKGDTVTWAGSAWTCIQDTEEKPGTDDWRLSVKKGRDASNTVKIGER